MRVNRELELGDIPGLGPRRQEALADAGVRTLRDLLALKCAELAAIRGVGVWQAKRIQQYLRQHGLLVEGEDADGNPALIAVVSSAEEASEIQEGFDRIQQQAAFTAQVEAEVERLAEAVAEAEETRAAQRALNEEPSEGMEDPPKEGPDASDLEVDNLEVSDLEVSELTEEAGAVPTGPEGESGTEMAEVELETDGADTVADDRDGAAGAVTARDEASPLREQVRARREQVPQMALDLLEAIRQAAVAPALARQVTRLMITSGEYLSEERELTEEQAAAAQQALKSALTDLRRDLERGRFSPGDQVKLAARIRKQRRALERAIEVE